MAGVPAAALVEEVSVGSDSVKKEVFLQGAHRDPDYRYTGKLESCVP